MKKFSAFYLILLIVFSSITITMVLADTVTISTYPYTIQDNSNQRLVIISSGNVGIGTVAPAQKLDVNGNFQTEGNRMMINGFDSASNFWIRTATGGSEASSLFMAFTQNAGTGGGGAVAIAPGGTLAIEALSSGNVGIGTVAPAQKLDVAGNIRLTGNIVSPSDICIGAC